MSKPEDIPQGVWDKAVVIADASEPSTETLARAILAAKAEERDAILALAEAASDDFSYADPSNGAQRIVEAIRKREG